jgi:hypothetical protein
MAPIPVDSRYCTGRAVVKLAAENSNRPIRKFDGLFHSYIVKCQLVRVGDSARRGKNGGPQGELCHWLMTEETSPGWQVGAQAT